MAKTFNYAGKCMRTGQDMYRDDKKGQLHSLSEVSQYASRYSHRLNDIISDNLALREIKYRSREVPRSL